MVLNRLNKLDLIHWTVIILSLALTLVVWNFSRQNAERFAQQEFQQEVDRTVELVLERMETYENALVAGSGFILAQDGQIDVLTWRKFAKGLHIDESYPGINGIGVIKEVPAPKRSTD